MKRVLQRTSLRAGNVMAWILMVFCGGFAIGWILNAERMYGFCVVP